MNTKIFLSLFCILHFAFCICQAQDVHFSQYAEQSLLRNPALTGISDGDFRASASYRSQWGSLGKAYQTLSATAEGRFSIRRNGQDYVSIGLAGYSDKAGRAGLKTTAFYPCINYHKHLSASDERRSFLSAGFAAGMLQRSFDPGALTFDNQYQNPGAGAGEELPIAKLSYWDLSAGLSYNGSVGDGDRLTFLVGLGAWHLTKPRATFSQTSALNLNTRWNASLSLNMRLLEAWSAEAHANVAIQGPYREAMLGGLLRWARLGNNDDSRGGFGIAAGAQLRFGDAVIPTLRVDYKSQRFGISYDVNTSSLKAATGMRGGLEITAVFSGFFHPADGGGGVGPRF